MLVVLVVAIVGIWIGACIWRRHYLRRKDRQYALGKNLASTTRSGNNPYGGGVAAAGGGVAGAQSSRSVHLPRAGLFQPANISEAHIAQEKNDASEHVRSEKVRKEDKRWTVRERT